MSKNDYKYSYDEEEPKKNEKIYIVPFKKFFSKNIQGRNILPFRQISL